LKSALQLGIGGPVLKPCGLPTTLIGGLLLCAVAGGIETTMVVVTSVTNTKNIAAKDIAAEFPLMNFIKTQYHDPCDKSITGNYYLKYQISCKYPSYIH
jgi:hypothetical protein